MYIKIKVASTSYHHRHYNQLRSSLAISDFRVAMGDKLEGKENRWLD